MEKVIPLQNLTDVKSFLQDKFTMVVDHSRQRIDFRPLQIRKRYDEGLDLIYEWYAKSFYHFINFNSAMLTCDLVVTFNLPKNVANTQTVAGAGDITQPYNSTSYINQQDLMYGQVLLNQIKDYGEIVPYLMALRDKQQINDEKTLRNSNTTTETYSAAPIGTQIAGNEDKTYESFGRTNIINVGVGDVTVPVGRTTLKRTYRLNIPIFSILEDAKLLPIYNLADPLRMVFKFNNILNMLQISATANTIIPQDAYLTNFHMYMDVYKVQDPALLTRQYYTFKSISYDTWGPNNLGPLNTMSGQIQHFSQSFSARWKNLKNAIIFFRNSTDPKALTSEKGLDALYGISDLFKEGIDTSQRINWTFANYNYPYQNYQDSISCFWWEYLQYFGRADNNGVEDARVLTFLNWYTTYGAIAIDFSTIPQRDDIISGVNTKQEILTLDMDLNTTTSKNTSCDMKIFFGRNVFFVIADGVIGKIE